MTQEEKQLLLKDLYARLPYGVKGRYCLYDSNGNLTDWGNVENIYFRECKICTEDNAQGYYLDEFKPYLRPMSSMTMEEIRYKLSKFFKVINTNIEGIGYVPTLASGSAIEYINWLNENHFDYNGLIEKGLALEAPEGMYKTE